MSVIKIEKALKLDKVIFVDVRTEGEYEEDHILNAINMPLLKIMNIMKLEQFIRCRENMKQYKKDLTMYRIN